MWQLTWAVDCLVPPLPLAAQFFLCRRYHGVDYRGSRWSLAGGSAQRALSSEFLLDDSLLRDLGNWLSGVICHVDCLVSD